MGLKTTNYEAKQFGITLPTAYARLTDIHIDIDGHAYGFFEIHQTREDLGVKAPFERIDIDHIVDKEQPIHKQLYEKAKETLFTNWEDDIVTEEE